MINETILLTITTSSHDRTRTRPVHSSLHEATSKPASFKSNSEHAKSGKLTSLSCKLGKTRFRVLRGEYGARLCMARMGGSIDSRLWNPSWSGVRLREGAGALGISRLLRSNWERLQIGSCLARRFVRPPSPMSLHINWAYTDFFLPPQRRAPISLVSLNLMTGAKHQLRIHLSKVLNGEGASSSPPPPSLPQSYV